MAHKSRSITIGNSMTNHEHPDSERAERTEQGAPSEAHDGHLGGSSANVDQDDTCPLTAIEARVVACLVEKSITTPNNYPLTVNSLTNAANQKSSRDPVMNLTEGQVGAALNALLEQRLVSREDGSRTVKWRHNFGHHYLLKPPMTAVLAAAILRGPQTKAELRAHSQPMRGPADADEMDAVIERLTDRAEPLLRLLGREPGRSAQRYIHTLAPVDVAAAAPHSGQRTAREEARDTLAKRVDALEARVEELSARLAELLD